MRSSEISSIYRVVADVPFGAQFGFELPTPVSLPFDYIMVTDSVSSIPKYDFSLEKKLANEMEDRRRREQLEALTDAQKKRNAEHILPARQHASTSSPLMATRHTLSLDHRHSVAVSGHGLATLGRPTSSASALPFGRPASADLTQKIPVVESANALSPRPHAATPDPPKPPLTASYVAYSSPKITHHTGYATSSHPLPTATTAPPSSTAESAMSPAASFAILPNPQAMNASPSAHTMGPPQSSAPMSPPPTTVGALPFNQHQHQQYLPQTSNPPSSSGYPTLSSPPAISMAQQWSQSPPVYSANYPLTMPISAPASSPPSHPPAATGSCYPPSSHRYDYPLNPALPPRPYPTATPRPPIPNPPSVGPAPPPLPPKTFQLSDYDYIQSAHPNTLLPPPPNSMPSAGYPDPAPSVMPDHNQYLGQAALSPLGPTGEDDESTVEQVRQLIAMGFSRTQAVHALEAYDYDLAKATNYLLDHS
ncbi:hypothetical protein H4R35_002924 [Dimargaris xerosporica]|nr:hypothetical protein H4R35_002924 [Dimargaris xerosporica]